MNSSFQRWLRSLRTLLIERLRPGRDEAELLAVIERAEVIQSDEQRTMLEQLVEFHDKRVREIMVPRSEIHSVAADAALSEVEEIMIESRVSRLLVTQGDLDHVLGVIHARDIIESSKQNESPAMAGMLRPCLRALELEQVSSLLTEMREHSCHIAIVLDEYGGTAGLITLSDLLREIVGEIGEDGEEEEGECQVLANGSYLVQARMHIEELGEALNMQLPEGDYDTVGGWITTYLGRIPLNGETVKLGHFHIQIMEADPRRISKIHLQIS
jgi:magnesium and cobalt transporter